MICPNKNHPDWKALVAKHGEAKAYRMFVENGNEIPVAKTTLRGVSFDAIKGVFVRKASTMDMLNERPDIAERIITKLKELYPEVRISRNGILDKNGQYVELEKGEKGMHYRNAFQSMVAWANDAYLETPPHEYAHHYIDMFRNHPMVAKAIENYGEERLVERIGKYYAGEHTNSGFVKLIKKFWNMARSLFGHPDLSYELYKGFREGKQLDVAVHPGTEIVRHQKTKTPMDRSTTYEVSNDEKVKDRIVDIDHMKEDVTKQLELVLSEDNIDVVEATRKWVVNLFETLKEGDLGADGKYRNLAVLDTRLIKDVTQAIQNNNVAEYIAHVVQVGKPLDFFLRDGVKKFSEAEQQFILEEANKVLSLTLVAGKRMKFVDETKRNFIADDNSKVSGETMQSVMEQEIEESSEKRMKLFDRIPDNKYTKPFKKFLQQISNIINKHQMNARLQAKFLSGDENSLLTKVMYHAFNKANHVKAEIKQKVDKVYRNELIPDSLKKGSAFFFKNGTIDELGAYEIETQGNRVTITKGEALSLYMLLRQQDSADTIMEHGVKLDSVIEGRQYDAPIKITAAEKIKLDQFIENQTDFKEVIEMIDKAFDTMHPYIDATHLKETGFHIEKLDNYFPVSTGTSSESQRRALKNIDYLKSGRARLGQDSPLRLSDAFSVVNTGIAQASHYSAYAVEVRNARVMIDRLRDHYKQQKSRPDYKQIMDHIDSLDGNINRIEDSSQLFSSESQKGAAKVFDKLMNNFVVSILSLNVPVMFKQPVSYLAAAEVIDKKYLKEVGWGVGMITGMKVKDVWDQLKVTGVQGGKTMLPIEWVQDETNPVYQKIIEWSPLLHERFKGQIDRELGETLMDSTMADDIIEIPFSGKLNFKNPGQNIRISKNKAMDGIKAFDTATIMSIWKAVQLEATEQYGLTEADGDVYWKHVASRTEEIVNKTQPTFDMNNRSSLAADRNPALRMLTMFSSARSKMAMLLVEGAVDYMNNPTQENKMKLIKRYINIGVLSAVTLTGIDFLKEAIMRGFDDDDEMYSFAATKMISANTGNFFGIGTMTDYIMSKLDNEPWSRDIQHPVFAMMEDVGDVVVETAKGDFDDAAVKAIESTFKIKGAPLYPWILAKTAGKRLTE